MAINFNNPTCIENTSELHFGICDDPHPDTNPAYLDYTDCDKWIAWVENDYGKVVKFTAIDHCIEILRANGDDESRCDGMLEYETTVIFVELKDRDSGRWLGGAMDQLATTISIYKREVGLNGKTRLYGYVANKQRPYFKAANSTLAEKFEDDTGFILIIDPFIKIY
jgi:hypothetical protein